MEMVSLTGQRRRQLLQTMDVIEEIVIRSHLYDLLQLNSVKRQRLHTNLQAHLLLVTVK
ncbi:unnamed protein product [Schistosoma mattheei]|uniref:Uncharacterized protein n=1 Tax=Schistosoma mattheei TaxID=31246 RepID=A0A3P8INE2_9TREM|nr:unnamed protein product [Schistosoma mattheei]